MKQQQPEPIYLGAVATSGCRDALISALADILIKVARQEPPPEHMVQSAPSQERKQAA